MNATLFVTPAELRDDEARAYALVPEESHTKLRRELRRSTPFVLTLKRSPSSYLFVFVASTPAEVEAIGKRWVALPAHDGRRAALAARPSRQITNRSARTGGTPH